MSNLTEDQLKLIEEKRQKALKLKQRKNALLSADQFSSTSQNFNNKQHFNLSPAENLTQNTDVLIRGAANQQLQCTVVSDDRFSITCKYNPTLISAFKTIPSRRYDPSTQSWTFLLSDFSTLGKLLKIILDE